MKIPLFCCLSAVGLLAGCNKSSQESAAEAAVPKVPVITEHASPHFMKVLPHLELGGSSFHYTDQEGFMAALAVMLDEGMKNMPEEQRKDVPAGLSFVKLFDAFGLNSVKAMGGSARKTDAGQYHSRSFAYMPGGRKGLATLNGGEARAFLTHEVAPAGTDLALEFPLHLKALAKEALVELMAVAPGESRAELEAQLDQPVPPLGMTVRELVERLDAQVGLFIQVDDKVALPVPGSEVPLPGVDALLVVDGLGWLLEPLKTQFMPMLLSPALPVEVTEKEGVTTVVFRAPIGAAPMDFQPVLRLDSKADRLMVATRVEFLNQSLKGEELLAGEAAFQKAWKGMPAEGNSALYVSPVFLKTLRGTMRNAIVLSKEPQSTKDMMGKVLDQLTPYLGHGQAACIANLPDGTLGVANLAFPLGDSSAVTTLTTLSVLSSLAVPTFNQVQGKANDTKLGSEGRQIGLALQAFAADHNGLYPTELGVLVTEGLLDSATLNSGNTWLYNPDLTSDSAPDALLLASGSPTKTGQRCVVRVSGILEFLTESDFEALQDGGLR